jgi:hypothetical protein
MAIVAVLILAFYRLTQERLTAARQARAAADAGA